MKKYLILDLTVNGHPAAPMVLIFPEEVSHAKVLRAATASVRANLPGNTIASLHGAGFVHIGEHCLVTTHGDCPELNARVSPDDARLISKFLLAVAQ